MALTEKERKSTKLTEALVLARTRASDLESVRKLNCWACQIGDTSIVRHMPNLEVCSLSVNNITSLLDFAHCPSLQELYVRKNSVTNLTDVTCLKKLEKLRVLWLSDNPCAEKDNYRMTVLRTLPNLQKLDNVVVTEDELNKALEEGDDLGQSEQLRTTDPDLPRSSPDLDPIIETAPKPDTANPQITNSVNMPPVVTSDKTPVTASDTFPTISTIPNCMTSVNSLLGDLEDDSEEEEEDTAGGKQTKTEEGDALAASAIEISLETPKSCHSIENEFSDLGQPELSKEGSKISEVSLACSEPLSACEKSFGKETDVSRTSASTSSLPSEDERKEEKDTSVSFLPSGDKRKEEKERPPSANSMPSKDKDISGNSVDVKPSEEWLSVSSSAADLHRERLQHQQDSVRLSLEETNHIRSQLGLKPLPMSKITPHRSVTTGATRARNANILQSVLLLTRELDKDSLEIVRNSVQKRLEDM